LNLRLAAICAVGISLLYGCTNLDTIPLRELDDMTAGAAAMEDDGREEKYLLALVRRVPGHLPYRQRLAEIALQRQHYELAAINADSALAIWSRASADEEFSWPIRLEHFIMLHEIRREAWAGEEERLLSERNALASHAAEMRQESDVAIRRYQAELADLSTAVDAERDPETAARRERRRLDTRHVQVGWTYRQVVEVYGAPQQREGTLIESGNAACDTCPKTKLIYFVGDHAYTVAREVVTSESVDVQPSPPPMPITTYDPMTGQFVSIPGGGATAPSTKVDRYKTTIENDVVVDFGTELVIYLDRRDRVVFWTERADDTEVSDGVVPLW